MGPTGTVLYYVVDYEGDFHVPLYGLAYLSDVRWAWMTKGSVLGTRPNVGYMAHMRPLMPMAMGLSIALLMAASGRAWFHPDAYKPQHLSEEYKGLLVYVDDIEDRITISLLDVTFHTLQPK